MKRTLREYLADLTASVNLDRILRIGRRATKKAQEDNRRMGIPNVYSINGQLYYELPNGELTTEDPMAGQHAEDETPAEEAEASTETSGEQDDNKESTEVTAGEETKTEEVTEKPSAIPKPSHNGSSSKTKKAEPTSVADESQE